MSLKVIGIAAIQKAIAVYSNALHCLQDIAAFTAYMAASNPEKPFSLENFVKIMSHCAS